MVTGGVAALLDLDEGLPHGRPSGRRNLAGQAQDGQRVAAIGFHVHVQHRVTQQAAERLAQRAPRVQDEDPVRVGREAQLRAGAEHALALDAGDARDPDTPAARQHGAGQRHGHALSDLDVGRAADDLKLPLSPSSAYPREREARGAGVGIYVQQLADDDRRPVGADAFDAVDLHAEQRQSLRQRLRG